MLPYQVGPYELWLLLLGEIERHQRVLYRRVTYLMMSYKNQCDCCMILLGQMGDGQVEKWKTS